MTKEFAKIKFQADWPSDFEPEDIRDFGEITKSFPTMLKTITNLSNVGNIYESFGRKGVGKETSRNILKSSFPQLKDTKDFQGIYLFWYKHEPFYTGISRGVIKRIHQHIKGVNHFSSSLSYSMGKQHYSETLGMVHKGTRSEMDFDTYSKPFKELLRKKCQFSILAIESPVELYLFEVYLAVELKLHFYNRFRTH